MPLILAIEPDRRQASQLTAMVRGRLHAELVLGESAERALAALGQRVPDLILTSALLSPKDENALGERLRALDGAAAHVQTLTIPVLASTSGRGSSRAAGMLSALRRDKGKPMVAHDGCDPAVFAEQCKEYLERAETDRAAFAEQAAAAALDAQTEGFSESIRQPASSVVRPSGGRESKKHKADHHQQSVILPRESSLVLPKAKAELESFHAPSALAVRTYRHEPEFGPTDPYVATAPDALDTAETVEPLKTFETLETPRTLETMTAPIAPPVVEEPADPVVKRKGQKSTKKSKVHGMKSVLGLSHDDGDGPASLLAAVAALEAEEHVEPIIAPIVETPLSFDTPSEVAAPVVTAPPVEPIVTYKPPVETSVIRPPAETSVIRPPVVEPEPAASEDVLDLSSLLDAASRRSSRQPSTFDDEPVVEVYELDNSLLTTSFDEAVQPETTTTEPFKPASIVNDAPRSDGRSWPVLDTLIAETAALQAVAPVVSASGEPSGFSKPPVREEAKPLGDILEALRRDAEQTPAATPSVPTPSQPSTFGASETAPASAGVSLSDIDVVSQHTPPADADDAENDKKKKKKGSKASPAQDEWGFFDPDQCGFAALIEKLEEITDKDDTPSPRRA